MPPLDPTRQALCDFLYYAYIPSREVAEQRAAWWASLLADPDVPSFSTVAGARDLLATIVSELVADVPRVKIGVTSGYDSRGVLGALLSVLPPDRIVAFTRGQPGNPDYEKARGFTRDVLPVHHLLPTQKAEFVAEVSVAGASAHPGGGPRSVAPATGRLEQGIEDFSSLPNMSGYLGDALSGKHLTGTVRGDFEAARARFLVNNRPFIPTELLPEFFPRDYDPGHVLPQRPMLPPSLMDPQDQLDFHYRQFQRIRLNAGQHEEAEMAAMDPKTRAKARSQMWRSRAPYADRRWQRSWMLVPFEERMEQGLYKRFLADSYPAIFPDLREALAKAELQSRANPRAHGSARPRPLRRLRSGLGRLVRRLRPPPPPPPPPSKAEVRARSALRTHTNWELLYEQNEKFRTEYCDPLIRSLAARRGLWFDPMRVHELAREEAYGYGTVLWGLLSMETAIRAGRLPEPE